MIFQDICIIFVLDNLSTSSIRVNQAMKFNVQVYRISPNLSLNHVRKVSIRPKKRNCLFPVTFSCTIFLVKNVCFLCMFFVDLEFGGQKKL